MYIDRKLLNLRRHLSEGFEGFDDYDEDDGDYEAIDIASATVQNLGIESQDIKKCLFAVSKIDALNSFKVNVDPVNGYQTLDCAKDLGYKCIKDAREKLQMAGWRISPYLDGTSQRFINFGHPIEDFDYWNQSYNGSTPADPYIKNPDRIKQVKDLFQAYNEITESFPEHLKVLLMECMSDTDVCRVGVSKDGGMYYYECYCRMYRPTTYGGAHLGFTGKLYYRLGDIYDKRAAKDADDRRKAFKRKMAALGKLLKPLNMYNDLQRTSVEKCLDSEGMPMFRVYVPKRYAYQWIRYYGSYRLSTAVDLSGVGGGGVPDKMYVTNDGMLYIAMYDGTTGGRDEMQQIVNGWLDQREAAVPEGATYIRFPWDWQSVRGNFIVEVGPTEAGLKKIGLK